MRGEDVTIGSVVLAVGAVKVLSKVYTEAERIIPGDGCSLEEEYPSPCPHARPSRESRPSVLLPLPWPPPATTAAYRSRLGHFATDQYEACRLMGR